MKQITISIPTKVYFGENVTNEALFKEKALLSENIMIVTTGRSLIKNGYLDQLCNTIKGISPNSTIHTYDGISNNPDISEISAAVISGKEKNIKTIIGFGGGSAIDAAKAVAAGIGEDTDIETIFYEGISPSEKTLPIIAIPTTSGTGSELSKAAIISSREKGIKSGIRGENLIPRVAIVDSVYTWTVPTNITMETGFDVLAHAIESYVSVNANIHSEMLSEKAIRIVGEYLPRLYKDINDHEARYNMSYASMLMGMNLKDVGTALPHRMQYPIGALTGTSHGVGLMALYLSWIKHEYSCNENRVRNALKILTGQTVQTQKDVTEVFGQFTDSIGGVKNLKELGIGNTTPQDLVERVTGNIANDPLSEMDGIIETIYTESI